MSEKDCKTSSKKTSQVSFSRAYCRLFLNLCKFVRLFLHGKSVETEVFKAQKKNGAMLVCCNHLSAYDFIHFASAMHGAPTNFVVAQNMMYSTPIFSKLLNSYHAITKRQYFADFQCIKSIKRYLDSGISVVICPEGKVSADGATGAILPSIARLIKWLGYPVGVIKMQGASLARPKWAYNLRHVKKGHVISSCDMLLSAQEAKDLSKEEILQKVCRALEHNEHKWQIENGVVFTGRRYAEGLNRLLYQCPKCGGEFCMHTHNNRIVCEHCNNEIEYRADGNLVPIGDSVSPKRIDLWYAIERESVKEQVSKEDFKLQESVNLLVENADKNGYRFIANGTLTLGKEKLCFDTTQTYRPKGVKAKYGVNNMTFESEDLGKELVEDEFKHIEFSTSRCDTVANLPGTAIDMYDDKHVYRFMFDKVMASTKYALAIEETYKLVENCKD